MTKMPAATKLCHMRSHAIQLMIPPMMMSYQIASCDSNHGSHFLYNQMNNHQTHCAQSNSGANMMQQMQTICPKLPPILDNQVNHNHHLYHQSHHMNAQMNHSTNLSFQNTFTTQPMTHPPKKSKWEGNL